MTKSNAANKPNAIEATNDHSLFALVDTDSRLPITHQIEVRGDVRTPGEFSFQREADIFHYLNLAGGALSDPRHCNLIVVRKYGEKQRSLLFRLDQRDYLPRIKQGDLLIVTDLGEDKKTPRQFHKPTIQAPKARDIVRPSATDYEKSLPSRAQSLKKQLDDYIKFPQFKRLVNRIASHQAATGVKSLAIMSYEQGEGKSFFCSALALAYSRYLDSQVMVIDSNRDENLRSPFIAVVKGDYSCQVPDQELHSEASFIDLASVSEIERDYHENSDFYFSPYIKSIGNNYDLILVDTCANSNVSKNSVDPMIISSQVDGVIVINSPLSLEKKCLEGFAKDLKTSGANVIGTIYNPYIQK
jgi:hypothetical protein